MTTDAPAESPAVRARRRRRKRILDLWRRGYDQIEIARCVGVSRSTVHNELHDAGLIGPRPAKSPV